jgi:hypothetical protein
MSRMPPKVHRGIGEPASLFRQFGLNKIISLEEPMTRRASSENNAHEGHFRIAAFVAEGQKKAL